MTRSRTKLQHQVEEYTDEIRFKTYASGFFHEPKLEPNSFSKWNENENEEKKEEKDTTKKKVEDQLDIAVYINFTTEDETFRPIYTFVSLHNGIIKFYGKIQEEVTEEEEKEKWNLDDDNIHRYILSQCLVNDDEGELTFVTIRKQEEEGGKKNLRLIYLHSAYDVKDTLVTVEQLDTMMALEEKARDIPDEYNLARHADGEIWDAWLGPKDFQKHRVKSKDVGIYLFCQPHPIETSPNKCTYYFRTVHNGIIPIVDDNDVVDYRDLRSIDNNGFRKGSKKTVVRMTDDRALHLHILYRCLENDFIGRRTYVKIEFIGFHTQLAAIFPEKMVKDQLCTPEQYHTLLNGC